MSAARVKGWCPSAYRPMMSGDGLLVRVRPFLGYLDTGQVIGVCDAALRFGNGIIDLTSRANLQIRGVGEDRHEDLLAALNALQLLSDDPAEDAKRNIVTTPLWVKGDLTTRMHSALTQRLANLPDLPSKMGIAIDTGKRSVLQSVAADFRFELAEDGALILRADGSATGCLVTVDTAIDQVIALATWFCDTGGFEAGRMARHLRQRPLPDVWTGTSPRPASSAIYPGPTPTGFAYGAPFGTINATALRSLINASAATGLRVTPWRVFLLEGSEIGGQGADFITDPNDPLRQIHACPGAPRCEQAMQPTQALAHELAPHIPPNTRLHVSGCAKGCAHRGATDITLVGTEHGYDLVRNGTPWDEPSRRGLSRDELLKDFAG